METAEVPSHVIDKHSLDGGSPRRNNLVEGEAGGGEKANSRSPLRISVKTSEPEKVMFIQAAQTEVKISLEAH